MGKPGGGVRQDWGSEPGQIWLKLIGILTEPSFINRLGRNREKSI